MTIPLAIAGLGLAVQALAFGRPPADRIIAADALRELLRYRTVTATESVRGRSLAATCVDGWFQLPGSGRPRRGALVLFGDGERLYDVGHGLRRAGPGARATGIDRVRFELAGCPLFVGRDLTARLLHDLPLTTKPVSAGVAIVVGPRHRPLRLLLARDSYRLRGLQLGGDLRGASVLRLGAPADAVARLRTAFKVAGRRVHGV
jgi:hypothetical protein